MKMTCRNFPSLSLILISTVLSGSALAAGAAEADADGDRRRVQVIRECLDTAGDEIECDDAAAERRVRVMVVEGGDVTRDGFVWKGPENPRLRELGDRHHAVFLGDMSKRGFLGVRLVELTPELRIHFGSSEDAGVMVGGVEAGSPAEAAGIRVGDILTSVDGEEVGSSLDVMRTVRGIGDGETAAVEILRDGRPLTLEAIITEREGPEVDVRQFFLRREGDGNGFEYEFDSEAMTDSLHKLQEHFTSPDFRTRIMTLQGLEDQLEARLKDLEKRLRDLERELEVKE